MHGATGATQMLRSAVMLEVMRILNVLALNRAALSCGFMELGEAGVIWLALFTCLITSATQKQ